MTDETRNDRIRKFLKDKYGHDLAPLRSYLTWLEAKELTSDNLPGRCVFSDADIGRYPGKHCVAVESSLRDGLDPATWPFWQKARQTYLEIGGDYKPGQAPPDAEIKALGIKA